jgi:hypothetical protein
MKSRHLFSVLLLSAVSVLFPLSAIGQTCTKTFSPSTVGSSPYPGSSVNAAIQGGTTSAVLCFSSGAYGEIDIYNAHPTGSGQLQIIPAAGATVTGIYFNLNGVSNVKVSGFCDTDLPSCPTSNGSNTGGFLVQVAGQGNNSNITYSYNSMTSNGVQVENNAVANAAILIDHNSFIGFTNSNESSRLNIVSDNSCPNGITVSNNVISGGQSDGMNTSGNSCGTQFLNNDISNILESNCGGIHCDGFQDNGGGVNTTLSGNYWHNVSNCWQITDGTTNLTMTNNVCQTGSDSSHTGQLSPQTMTFTHNTIISPGESINIGNDSTGKSVSNLTIINNVFAGGTPAINPGQSVSGTFVQNYDLCPSGCPGSNSLNGNPTFVGGTSPSSYPGYALTATSLGHGAASDSGNMGIAINGTQPGTPSGLVATVQ